ncbi:hypothetical protein SPURM210S_07619 [Streptomyces purpurascens]
MLVITLMMQHIRQGGHSLCQMQVPAVLAQSCDHEQMREQVPRDRAVAQSAPATSAIAW